MTENVKKNRMRVKPKKVWLIRHTESEANVGGRTSDPAAIPLTAQGRLQAEQLVAAFIEKPSLIVSSRYLRAKQTAQPVRNKFKRVRYEEWDVHEFTFISPDRCHDTTKPEREPLVDAYWQRYAPNYCDGKGAESFSDFMGRVCGALKQLKEREAAFCAVFSHMQFITAVLWRLEDPSRPIDSKAMKDYQLRLDRNPLPNGSITEVLLDSIGI